MFAELPPWTGAGDIEKFTGEICVRGPQVMKGYWNSPAETAKVMQDGWLRTGDIGHMDGNGWFTITDRKKDMILVSGFNVYPNEVESVVATLPGVLECGVVGVPDAKTGEAVKVVVVRKDPGLTAETRDRALQGAPHRLQGPASRGVPRRHAEDADRQDPQAGVARRAQGVGGIPALDPGKKAARVDSSRVGGIGIRHRFVSRGPLFDTVQTRKRNRGRECRTLERC